MQKYLFLLISVFSVALTCTPVSDPVSASPECWPVTVYAVAEQPQDAYYRLTVSGEGVLPLGINPVTAGDCIMVNVPAGTSRLFECCRYQQNSMQLTDTGSVVADVKEGLNTVVLKLAPIPVPVITSQPEDFSLTCRGYAWFTITAEGLDCSYEWQKNDISYAWQSAPFMSTDNIGGKDSGSTFRCIVCNASGCDTSREAVLSVLPDTEPPVIVLLDSMVEVYLDSVYEDNGVFAFDSLDFDLSDCIARTGKVNTEQPGEYTITYSVADSSGNVAHATRTVIVRPFTEEDLSIPVISLLEPDTSGSLFGFPSPTPRDSGFYAYDREDGDITAKVIVSDWIPIYRSLYYCTYDVTDSDGNVARTQYRFENLIFRTIPPPPY